MSTKLQSLELQGYKTFAQKVRLEFPGAITAIVGPNGSGKSNVSDAIRWVLGEQSYTLLRGRKTMDMIFAGSDQKARAGMASVTITFRNEDGWLPIDYDEVALTRRAYRSGENEYHLNGQRVRLKDINELLGQSGLAERTYTIIGQGLIDTALALKADERRSFFEEAAGIGLFRGRRDEAVGRLDQTRRNLERISDILAELEPRLASLSKQAKRAKEYESLKADLKALLRDWYGYHWHKSQGELSAAIRGVEAQSRIAAEARARQGEKERLVNQIQARIKAERDAIGELHRSLSQVHAAKERAAREAAILSERLIAADRSLKQFGEESELNQVEYQHQEERLAQTQQEIDRLRKGIETAGAEKKRVEAELETQLAEMNTLRRRLSDQRNQSAAKENDKVRVKARLDEARERLRSIDASNRTFEETGKKAESELAGIREKLRLAAETVSANEAAYQAAANELAQVRQEAEALLTERAAIQSALAEIRTAQSQKKARLDVLTSADANLTGVNQGAQFLVQAAKKSQLTKAVTTIGALFRFPKEAETAAAAVLGEALDGVIVDRSDWAAAAGLLRAGNNGRVVISDDGGDRTMESGPNEALLAAGCVPLMAIVETEPEYAALARRFLDGAYLIGGEADAAEAFRKADALRSVLRPGETLVTAAGERFDGDGVVIAGTNPKVALLSRKREMRELAAEIERIGTSEAAENAKLSDLALRIDENSVRQSAISEKRKELAAALDGDRKAHSRLQIDVQKQEQFIAFQRQRIQENEAQREKLMIQINADRQALAAAECALETIRTEIRALQDAIHAIHPEELQSQLQYWTIEYTVTGKSIREAEARAKEAAAQMERNQARIAANGEKIRAIEDEIAVINERSETLRREETESGAEAKRIEAAIQPAEGRLTAYDQSAAAAQSDFQSAQQRSAAAEKSLMVAQLEVSRLQNGLDSLKSRIEEDFGLVSFDFDEKVIGQSTLPLGDLVSELASVEEIPESLNDQIQRMKSSIRRMGPINPEAIREYDEVQERYAFLKTQLADVRQADKDLREVIVELEEMMRTAFQTTFEKVQSEFRDLFTRLFGGGTAKLVLTDPDDLNSSGIDIQAKLPGRREQELSLLSGGERSLTAVALVFALLRVSPTPFCVFDEVDAALDEANVGRFCELLRELSNEIQFILITHNRNTVETADVIYGVTISKDSISQVVSLRLDDVDQSYFSRA